VPRLLSFRDVTPGVAHAEGRDRVQAEPAANDLRGAVVMSAVCNEFELATIAVGGKWLAVSCIRSNRLPRLPHAFSSEENARFVAYLGLATHFAAEGTPPPGFDAFVWRREPNSAAWVARVFGAGEFGKEDR